MESVVESVIAHVAVGLILPLTCAYLSLYLILRGRIRDREVLSDGVLYQTNYPRWAVDLARYRVDRSKYSPLGKLFIPLIIIDSIIFTTFYIAHSTDGGGSGSKPAGDWRQWRRRCTVILMALRPGDRVIIAKTWRGTVLKVMPPRTPEAAFWNRLEDGGMLVQYDDDPNPIMHDLNDEDVQAEGAT